MFAQLILYVADQQRSKNFYESLLQVEPVLDVPGMTEFLLSAGCKLGLMPEQGIAKILSDKTPHPSVGNGIPRCELYLYINDLKENYIRIQEMGIAMISELSVRDWGDEAFYFANPDGHIIAFATRL